MPGYLTWRKVDLPLSAARVIWLASTRPDGRPHAMPVWFVWDGESIVFTTGRVSQKARNLDHQPAVVLHLGDGDDVIALDGSAVEVTEATELSQLNEAYGGKYVDPHSGMRATILNEGDAVFRVQADRIVAWEYGVFATRTEWRSPFPHGLD